MKKAFSILAILLIAGAVSFAQESKKVVLEETYTIENTAAEDIYLRAYDWITTYMSNPGFAITSDIHKTNSIEITGDVMIGTATVQATFKYITSANKCKLTISNLSDETEATQKHFQFIINRMPVILGEALTPEAKTAVQNKL